MCKYVCKCMHQYCRYFNYWFKFGLTISIHVNYVFMLLQVILILWKKCPIVLMANIWHLVLMTVLCEYGCALNIHVCRFYKVWCDVIMHHDTTSICFLHISLMILTWFLCYIYMHITAHTSAVYEVSWSSDSQYLASCSHDNTVLVWGKCNIYIYINTILHYNI